MKHEDLLKSPLLRELDAAQRDELLGSPKDGGLRESVETCATHKAHPEDIPPVSYSNAESPGPSEEKKVHKWTPATPMGRRCLKE
jgi:hypothetical protein